MYTVKAKPVFSVPVSTGIASSAAAASENGVSLCRVKVRSRQLTTRVDSKIWLCRGTHHANQPYRGAGRTVLFGLFVFWLFERQQRPDVQFASEPVA